MKTHTLRIHKKIKETPHVYSLYLEKDTDPIWNSFIPGQYSTIYLPELNTPEGKAYSIASHPTEPYVQITVEERGVFSKALCAHTKGENLHISSPYGFFYREDMSRPVIYIAGGIGVTPFRSMLLDTTNTPPTTELWYSSKTLEESIFKKEFEQRDIVLHHHITREHVEETALLHQGRIDIAKHLNTCPQKKTSDFMICGSISFVRDMRNNLKAEGIDDMHIYTESFF